LFGAEHDIEGKVSACVVPVYHVLLKGTIGARNRTASTAMKETTTAATFVSRLMALAAEGSFEGRIVLLVRTD